MTADAPGDPHVIVEDVGVDAVLQVEDGEAPLLVLRPGQTFTSACEAVARAVPQMHPDAVRRLVRRYLPDASDFALLGLHPADDPVARALPPTPRLSRRMLTVLALAALLGLVAVSGALVAIVNRSEGPDRVVGRDSSQWKGLPLPAAAPFRTPLFKFLLDQGWRCHDESVLTATCIGGDHQLVAVDASIGPDFIGYTFDASEEHGGTALVRVYTSDSHASMFAAARRRGGDHSMVSAGPYAITGDGRLSVVIRQMVGRWVWAEAVSSAP